MKTQIVNISIKQSSRFISALYFVISLPIMLIVAAVAIAKGSHMSAIGFAFIVPLLYAMGAYLGTAISAWIYNFVAKRVGGFEFTTAEVAERA